MKLVGVFAYRYDAHLVPDLLENISFCDDVVSIDDRRRREKWYHEGEMRQRLLEMALEQGADWVLCIDPDERLEKSAGRVIRKATSTKAPIIYRFHFRELYEPQAYRVDGDWATKSKDILFPLLPKQRFMNLPVHSQWAPLNSEYRRIHTGLHLYHLKMIDPKNRVARKDLYNELDPDRSIQSIGYDYLASERGMRLEQVSGDREYSPPYRADYRICQVADQEASA